MGSVPQPRGEFECPDCDAVLATRQGRRRHRRTIHGVIETEKHCTRCERLLALGKFKVTSTDPPKWSSECRDCLSGLAADRRSRQTPAQRRRDRKHYAARWFGITLVEYDEAVAALSEKQDGKCAICGSTEDLVLDHCHKTKRIRGLLCRKCNSGLGMFRDNLALLIRAIAYLKG